MKSLTILHTEWSNGWGGQEMRIIEESRGIAARGHRVIIVARPECQILPKARAAKLETRDLEMRRSFDLRAMSRLRALIRAENADIVNTHSSVDSWIGAFAVKGTRAKLVRTRHLSAPVARHPLNFVYRMPDAVVTTGEFVRQQLISRNRLDAKKVVSIPTGVDVGFYSLRAPDLAAKQSHALADGCKVASIVGILRRVKRHDLFLEAASVLRKAKPELRFLIAGNGPQRENIERIIAERGLKECVVMTGHCEDVRPIVSFSDVVVLCSDAEGVPQSVAQALSMARPVVATDVGGVGELVINEKTGLLVPPNDAAALVGAIQLLLDMPSFATGCGMRGREHMVKNCSLDRMIERTLALYEKLLS